MTSLVDTLDSKHKVSTANADTSSAVVKPAKGIDESAAVVVGYGMVPLMKSSRAKPGSFEDRSWDGSSCARTVCPFFRSALSHAASFFWTFRRTVHCHSHWSSKKKVQRSEEFFAMVNPTSP